GEFSARWRGCVIVAEDLWINDIAMLADGGFVATHMMQRAQASTIFDRQPRDRQATGYLVQWHKSAGWKQIAGTEGALPNGIQLSSDDQVIYTNHYMANEVVAYELATGKRLWTSAVRGAPDNMSLTPDGRLLVSAQLADLITIRDQCLLRTDPICTIGFAVYSLDTRDGSVTEVVESQGPPFGGATIAVEAGGFIYLGAFSGNRIARIPAPK
ncbi:MAG: outer membrane protein assembly factor BamB, partial [Gammaproteobacteria bacterium]